MTYEANKKAWMTGEIFTRWLRCINNQMALQSRFILLFIDNCAAHPLVELSNVRLAFFPPNTTSRLQPMDAGVIQTLKLNYRKMMRHVAAKLDEASKASDAVRSINVLDAVQWVRNAWDKLQPSTISKCFANCGFFQGHPRHA